MPRITSLDGLDQLKGELLEKRKQEASRGIVHVTVSTGTCGIAVGALDVLTAVEEKIRADHLSNIIVSQTGCIGLCSHEPILEVTAGEAPKVTYGKVTPEIAQRIIQDHIVGGKVVEDFVIEASTFPTI